MQRNELVTELFVSLWHENLMIRMRALGTRTRQMLSRILVCECGVISIWKEMTSFFLSTNSEMWNRPGRGFLLHTFWLPSGISIGKTRKYIHINICILASYQRNRHALLIAFC